jgi:hypothetical protein
MYVQRASALSSLVAVLLCSAALPAAAQTAAPAMASPAAHAAPMVHAAPAVPPASAIITVSNCTPALNLSQTGGGFAGWAPGWRGGPWGDPWGATFVQPPVTTTMPQLAIGYMNISHKTMTEIEFGLVANGVLLAEVRDVGTFTPHAKIEHRFGISANVFPIRTGLPQCPALRVTFADGTKWRNPRLPPKNTHIYYHP